MHGCAKSISASATMAECLSFRGVSAGYGETVVLENLSLSLAGGGTLAVLGRNGVGKTTLLATVMGHTTRHAGAIAFNGQAIESLATYRRALLGIGYVPQEREIFPSLTVDENLTVAARAAHGGRWSMERVFELFPQLGNLSASARTLHFDPKSPHPMKAAAALGFDSPEKNTR